METETVAVVTCAVCKKQIAAERVAEFASRGKTPKNCAACNKAIVARYKRIQKEALRAVEDDEQIGICMACESQQSAEPDARRYTCEACGKPEVFGASEILFMF
jgi:predicted RNA-binding Zn-ribbon protein involved in translation (DUF1610 family)